MTNHKLERALMGHEYCEGCNTIYPSPLYIAQHCYFCHVERREARFKHGKHIGQPCNCALPPLNKTNQVLHFTIDTRRGKEDNWVGACSAHAWQKLQNPLFHVARASI